MEIYFLRHGETAWNRERRIQGSTEWTDLSEDGVRLAEETRDGMIAANLSFDRLYTSPYLRAMHTARILGDGLGLEPVADPRLRELNFGEYEGTRYGEGLFVDDNIKACFTDPPRYVAHPGAESFDELYSRVKSFMENVAALPLSRVLAVAHGGVLRTVMRVAGGLPLAEFWQGRQPNCSVHVVRAEGGRFSIAARAVTYRGDF